MAYDTDEYKFVADSDNEIAGLGIKAGVSSTTLINNATVALDWTGADFSKKDTAGKLTTLGKIAASVKIVF